MPTQAFFLPADGPAGGQRLCLYHPADDRALAAVVYVHPFAEEMNKSRRMAAVASRTLAKANIAVLQLDLLGCGDSSGDFGEANWGDWVEDVLLAARWLRERVDAPLWLWGLRAGCLLTAEAAQRMDGPLNLLWWAPVASGKQQLQQFLRLKSAGEILKGQAGSGAAALRDELAAGRSVEVAGYAISPGLAIGMAAAVLSPSRSVQRLEVVELGSSESSSPSPAVSQAMAAWQREGVAVQARHCRGPAFWQTTEIEEAPAMVDATVAAITGPVLVEEV